MFELRLKLSLGNLDALKANLRTFLPKVSACHRMEAFARGAGFNAYASYLAAIENHETAYRSFDGAAFGDYLASKDMPTSPIGFYRAGAKTAIQNVLEIVPRLTSHGFGIQPAKRSTSWQEDFLTAKQELFEQSSLDSFLRSLALISRIPAIKTINPNAGSYRLKHISENFRCWFPTGERLGPDYVNNGSFIAAAIHAGFRWRNYAGSPNAAFNMASRTLDDLDCEIRPDGSRAQERLRKESARKQAKTFGLPLNRFY